MEKNTTEGQAIVTRETTERVNSALVAWYGANRRDLPWRRRQHDPYAVWVSEIMLQQTQVATVIPFYERWMERFPTVQALASAPLEEVLKYWAGLGYYARARNLHRAATVVAGCHSGAIPCDKRLLELPGVGRYTQGAIRSIAFGQAEPIVDANVARVLCRLFALGGYPKSTPVQSELWRLAEELMPRKSPGDHNQALMELGALVCTPTDPSCHVCPLLGVCKAGNSADPTAWPQNPPGRATVRVTHASAVVREGNCFLVARRPERGLWGGLWEFPRRVCDPGESPDGCAVRAARQVAGLGVELRGKVGSVKHAVTHHAITLHGFEAAILSGKASPADCEEIRWVGIEEMAELPLPAPQSLLVQLLQDHLANERRGDNIACLFAHDDRPRMTDDGRRTTDH